MRRRLVLLIAIAVAAAAPGARAQESSLRAMSDDAFIAHVRETLGTPRSALPPEQPPHGKCALELTVEIARRQQLLTGAARTALQNALAPQPYDTSIVSPSGRFLVHFSWNGSDAPALLEGDSAARIPGTQLAYAQAVAGYFDHAYDVEVTQRGYQAPPFESGLARYNIYIRNMADYGRTITNAVIPGSTRMPLFTSYIQIENDFAGFYSPGLRGASVTAAHEFHHMIQLGCYGLWDQDLFFLEMTSTYYEDVVYPEVNDYYQYLRDFFRYPFRAMYNWDSDGYMLVLFPKMLEEKYGRDVLPDTWLRMKQRPPITALHEALQAAPFNSSLGVEYCTFARWNWYTAHRSGEDSSTVYAEAARYPAVNVSATQPIAGGTVLFNGHVWPLATEYVCVVRGVVDTIAVSVTNTDVALAVMKSQDPIEYALEVRDTEGADGFTPMGNGWSYRFTPSQADKLCLNLYARDAIVNPAAKVHPNPFRPGMPQHDRLYFTVPLTAAATRATLAVFTVGMDRVCLLENQSIANDPQRGRYIAWDGRNSDGTPLSSGVYVYMLTCNNETLTGKFAVVRQ